MEIGVFNGDGIAKMARAYPDKKFYAVDPFIEDGHTVASSGTGKGSKMTAQKENYLNNTRGITNLELFETTSQEFYKNLKNPAELDIDTVVIDGNHHYESVVNDFELAMYLLGSNQGIIVVDDTDVPGVAKALNEFVQTNLGNVTVSNSHGSTKLVEIKGQ